MADDNKHRSTTGSVMGSSEAGFRPGRRKVVIAGALLVPTIVTLHGTPAWAQTDYFMTAYKYGDGAGKCKNPHWNPNANPDSTAGQKFVDCPAGTGSGTDDGTGGTGQDSGPMVF